jgi:hypothetical protein
MSGTWHEAKAFRQLMIHWGIGSRGTDEQDQAAATS